MLFTIDSFPTSVHIHIPKCSNPLPEEYIRTKTVSGAVAAVGAGAEHGELGWSMMRNVGKYDSHVEKDSRMKIQTKVHAQYKIAISKTKTF